MMKRTFLVMLVMLCAGAVQAEVLDYEALPKPVFDRLSQVFNGGFFPIYHAPVAKTSSRPVTDILYSMHLTRFSSEGRNVWLYWERRDYVPFDTTSTGQRYEHIVVKWRLDCVQMRTQLLSFTSYDSQGSVVASDSSLGEWEDIVPGSVGEKTVGEACQTLQSMSKSQN